MPVASNGFACFVDANIREGILVETVLAGYRSAKVVYDRGELALVHCLAVAGMCLRKLQSSAEIRHFGHFSRVSPVPYSVATCGEGISRPFRADLFEASPDRFDQLSTQLFQSLGQNGVFDPVVFDRAIYTAVTAFSLCVDVWKPKSRKTPGTFFEVLIGSAARHYFPHYVLTKHVPIRDVPVDDVVDALVDTDEVAEDAGAFSANSVSTDLVISNPATDRGAIIPLKITTRERIVQPFAHQRILSSAYPNRYASFIACISEVQRDDKTQTVKQICVPGTIALFQKHLANVNGLYYCDIPRRYAQADFTKIIAVQPFHRLFLDIETYLSAP